MPAVTEALARASRFRTTEAIASAESGPLLVVTLIRSPTTQARPDEIKKRALRARSSAFSSADNPPRIEATRCTAFPLVRAASSRSDPFASGCLPGGHLRYQLVATATYLPGGYLAKPRFRFTPVRRLGCVNPRLFERFAQLFELSVWSLQRPIFGFAYGSLRSAVAKPIPSSTAPRARRPDSPPQSCSPAHSA